MATGPLIQVISEIYGLLQLENINNTAPLFHKKLQQHTGIQVSGRFKTTDNTEYGEMSYITLMRNETVYAPHDGFGIAWRKQPEFLIDCANNGTNASDEHQEQFFEVYGETLAAAINILGDYSELKNENNGHKNYLKYNVYLVDNDTLQEEVWIGTEQLWDQTGGKNQFLQAGKVWIESDTWYEYNFKIHEKLAVEAWVWNPADDPADPLASSNRVLWRGQTYPPYIPQAAGEHFGISVAQTRNCEWYYDNLLITSFVETFPMHLFNFYPSSEYFSNSGAFTVSYYGVGYDPTEYVLDGNEDHSRVRAWMRNYRTSEWEFVGGHTNTIDDSKTQQKLEKSFSPLSDYKNDDGAVSLIAHAANSGPAPGAGLDPRTGEWVSAMTEYDPETGNMVVVQNDFSDDVNHTLRTYYVSLSNYDLEGVHRGNTIDVYCNDATNIRYGSTTILLTDNRIYTEDALPNIGGALQEITELRLHLSQTTIDPTNYVISSVSRGNEFSTDANYKIEFSTADDLEGALIDVVYKYWTRSDTINAYVNSDSVRYPGSDYQLKTMPPAIVKINSLEYSGDVEEEDIKEQFINYINNLTTQRLDKSDIISAFYNFGADYVNTDDLEIIIRHYTYEYEYLETTMSDFYEISSDNVGRFFTDKQELFGIIKV